CCCPYLSVFLSSSLHLCVVSSPYCTCLLLPVSLSAVSHTFLNSLTLLLFSLPVCLYFTLLTEFFHNFSHHFSLSLSLSHTFSISLSLLHISSHLISPCSPFPLP